jgi:hypothetical protein
MSRRRTRIGGASIRGRPKAVAPPPSKVTMPAEARLFRREIPPRERGMASGLCSSPWLLSPPRTFLDARPRRFSMAWSASTSNPFSPTRASTAMAACLATSSRSFAPSLNAECSPKASLAVTATVAATICLLRLAATVAASARVAAVGAWRTARRTWWTGFYPMSPSGSTSFLCPMSFAGSLRSRPRR